MIFQPFRRLVNSFRYRNFLLIIMADFLFFFCYGLVVQPLLNLMLGHITAGLLELSRATAEAGRSAFMTGQPPYSPEFISGIKYGAIFGILAFLVFCFIYIFFQSVSWWSAASASGIKIQYVDYLKRFTKSHLILWFPLFLLYQILSLALALNTQIQRRIQPDYQGIVLPIILYTLSIFFLLALLNHYLILHKDKPNRNAFRLFVTRNITLVPLYIIIAGVGYGWMTLLGTLQGHLSMIVWTILVNIVTMALLALLRLLSAVWLIENHFEKNC